MNPDEWGNIFTNIQRKGVLMDENILTDNFHDVVNKAFDQDMGFGYISEHGYQPKAKVILQGRNPFVDNHSVCTLYKISTISYTKAVIRLSSEMM